MPRIVPPEIDAYVEAHTSPPSAALGKVIEVTRPMQGAGMMTGPVEGRLLEFLVFALQPRLVLEIGTFTGYSSISLASTLPAGGKVITCDVNAETQKIAKEHADEAGVVDRIDYRLGPALDTIGTLDGPFDLVFIDADKENYSNYYDAVFPKLAASGVIAVDNTLWSGRVLDDSDESESTVAIRTFNDKIAADERVICVQLTVRDGVTLIRKR
jgi:caffeoyl-CoA O-methyltransferase